MELCCLNSPTRFPDLQTSLEESKSRAQTQCGGLGPVSPAEMLQQRVLCLGMMLLSPIYYHYYYYYHALSVCFDTLYHPL